MKVLVAYLFAFYVLALSCIPCQDEPVTHSDVAAKAVSDAGDGHSEVIDLCSPLCICACCASVTISPVAAVLPDNPVTQLVPPTGFSYLQTLSAGDMAGIWQPPKERV
ncbi:DUF6660 family protein [Dyadobacter sp. 676]|uniref:DUF6660 family protein n=1 Tax=Dyadobacter sp. 676 TaxID=3088362 RepID=A0AAU8FF50_9BACT